MSFEAWWSGLSRFDRPFGTAAKIIAAKAWNAGVAEACAIFVRNEGVDFGIEETLRVTQVDGSKL